MAIKLMEYVLWIADDGSYGGGHVLVMKPNDITEEQADRIENMHESDRFWYVQAIMNGEPLDKWEN